MSKAIPPLGVIPAYDLWHLKAKDASGNPIRSAAYGKGKRWRSAYQDGLRFAPYTQRFRLKQEAEDWAETQVSAIRHTGLHVNRDRSKITLREWMPEWLELQVVGKSSLNTYKSLCNTISRYDIADLHVSAIREYHVKRFMAQLKESESTSAFATRIAIFGQLTRIMSEARQNELCTVQPCTKKAKPVILKDDVELDEDDEDSDEEGGVWVPTTEQALDFYDHLHEDLKLAFWLGAGFGLRAKEVCGAKVETFRPKEPDYRLTQQWMDKRNRKDPQQPYQKPKSRSARRRFTVDKYVSGKVVELLDGRTEGLMVTMNGRPLTYATLRRWVNKAAKAAGLPVGKKGMHFHSLRHWYISTMIAGGVDVVELCIRSRHSSPDITYRVYAHLLNQPRGRYSLGEELQRADRERRKQRAGLRVV